jgi:hypothetical protein
VADFHYRKLRALGITIRKTANIIIGTFRIEQRHAWLHGDRDFEAIEAHLGLRVVDRCRQSIVVPNDGEGPRTVVG